MPATRETRRELLELARNSTGAGCEGVATSTLAYNVATKPVTVRTDDGDKADRRRPETADRAHGLDRKSSSSIFNKSGEVAELGSLSLY